MDESSSVGSGSRGNRRRVIAVAVAAVAVVGLVGVVLVAMGTGSLPRQGTATTYPNPILSQCVGSGAITAPCSVNGQSLAGRDLSGSTLTGVWGMSTSQPSKLPTDWATLPAADGTGFYLVGPGADLTNAHLTGASIGGFTSPCLYRALPGFDLSGTNFTGATMAWPISTIPGIYGACEPVSSAGVVARPNTAAEGGITWKDKPNNPPTLTATSTCNADNVCTPEKPLKFYPASQTYSVCSGRPGQWRAGYLGLDVASASTLVNCAF